MGTRRVHHPPPNKPKWDECPFEKKDSLIIVEEDGTETPVAYHNCLIDDLGDPEIFCPHEAKHCHFKEECIEFEELIMMACFRDLE